MVTVEEHGSVPERMPRAVGKLEARWAPAQRAQRGVVRNASENKDGAVGRERCEVGSEEAVARTYLVRRRLVGGRQAFH